MNWAPVIGIEVHVELDTASKMFCGCRVSFGDPPNTNVCPVCLALPGSLPVPNREAIERIIRLGLALNCRINPGSVFHRKNYYYADLPKNYQISQFDIPVCVDGWLDVESDEGSFRVGIERVHMEEDTGKSVHVGEGGRIHTAAETLVDFNRAGTPLVEIVSRPDLRSAADARAYTQELRAVVAETGVSDARMERGSVRFDANVSIRPPQSQKLGVKVEIKNMNSFRSLEKAIRAEVDRQVELVEAGEKVVMETRHWDESAGITHGMRTKEGSSDYRYFTEPDLAPMVFSESWVQEARSQIPELPARRRERYRHLGLNPGSARVLAGSEPDLRGLFEDAVESGAAPVPAANWVTGDITASLRRRNACLGDVPLHGEDLAALTAMVSQGRISARAARQVLEGVMDGEGSPTRVARARNLEQISDQAALEQVVEEVMSAHSQAVERYRSGEKKVRGFLVGQVMRATSGRADPRAVNQILSTRL
ncbi:MAG: Asp-tRNA(Asn)/Glu-tRNA(Gln) amidotransferase subunit GatB [bacterium]|nr:Asp-tRNA(Asn)/Glu-tRNA(Gln) amidotransferase subunit GatB [Acidimicrobiia bacterium]MCY4648824.1 Asp-tRNA(Asn)/Glu-tRNA(Gln) amidotransferase subunit GatB [bacterium]